MLLDNEKKTDVSMFICLNVYHEKKKSLVKFKLESLVKVSNVERWILQIHKFYELGQVIVEMKLKRIYE